MQQVNNHNSDILVNLVGHLGIMIWITLLGKCLSTKHVSIIPCLEIKVRIGAIKCIVWISLEVE